MSKRVDMVYSSPRRAGDRVHVFVAAPGQADDDGLVFGQRRREFADMGEGVGRFQGRDDAFGAGDPLEGVQRLVVGDGDVFGAARVLEVGVFGADAGVVQARRDAVGRPDLPVLVLQDVRRRAVQDALAARRQRRRVVLGVDAAPGGLDADQPHARVVDERVEDAHRVGAAADAGDDDIGQAAGVFLQLLPRFDADDRSGSRGPWSGRGAARRPCR